MSDTPNTSASLLERLREPADAVSWARMMELYGPMLRGWARRSAVPTDDVEDLVQEVLTAVVRELPDFRYDPARGSFRGWLRTITINRLRAYWRQKQTQPKATGDSDFAEVLDQLADSTSSLSRVWDQEHDRHVARQVLAQAERAFEPQTWQAFRQVVIDGQEAAKVAENLGLSPNAVYIAKHRVLRWLRHELRGLVE